MPLLLLRPLLRATRRAALLLASLTALAPSARAQAQAAPRRPARAPGAGRAASTPATVTYDATRLPAASLVTMAQLEAYFQQRPKGEYESTAEYQARNAARVGGTYAVALSNPADEVTCFSRLTYNADAKQYEAHPGYAADAYGTGSVSRKLVALPVVCTRRMIGHYTASNAFGRSTQVTRMTGTFYQVGMEQGGPSDIDGPIVFPMAPDSARRYRGRLSLVLLFTPAVWDVDGAVLRESAYAREPKLSSPTDETYRVVTFAADNMALALVDPTDGTILGITADFHWRR